MPVINKPPRAKHWAVIAIALVGSAISFKVSWILPIIAAFGGIVVYRGLSIEKRAAEALEKVHQEPPRVRAIKHIENIGWGILMAGILAEIVIASALAARDVYEEWENKPLNQPITKISASVTFITETNNFDGTNANPWVALMFLCETNADMPSSKWMNLGLLVTERYSKLPELAPPYSGKPIYSMNFELEEYGWMATNPPTIGNASEISRVRALELWTMFLPPKLEITYGHVTLIVNDRIKKIFIIPAQLTHNKSNFPLGAILFATNSPNL